MVPDPTLARMHPSWVQVAEKPSNLPFAGWVTTTFCSLRITPPPTGTSLVATSPSADGAWLLPFPVLPEVAEDSWAVVPGDPPPQPAKMGRLSPPTAAPARAQRRVSAGSVTGRLLVLGCRIVDASPGG